MNKYVPRQSRNVAPVCSHPERQVKSRGLCGSCYNKALENGIGSSSSGICPLCQENPRGKSKAGNQKVYCDVCSRRADKAWKAENPERWAYLQWKAKLKHTFNITPEIFNAMWDLQKGLCAICELELLKPLTTKTCSFNKACIDHNHSTGKVRALLCNPCNMSLGKMKESPELLRKAASYLELHGRN